MILKLKKKKQKVLMKNFQKLKPIIQIASNENREKSNIKWWNTFSIELKFHTCLIHSLDAWTLRLSRTAALVEAIATSATSCWEFPPPLVHVTISSSAGSKKNAVEKLFYFVRFTPFTNTWTCYNLSAYLFIFFLYFFETSFLFKF